MSLRAGIIGLGGISGAHITGWQDADGVEPVAGADISEEAVERVEEHYGITGYTDWREMLEAEQPDLVSVCTPPFLHPPISIHCLENGIHVLCEKPMAADIAGAVALARAARDADALLMVAYCHRHHGPMLKMKELIDDGILGKPLFFRGCFTGLSDMEGNHRGDMAKAGGGALMDNGSHAIDLFQFLLGRIANVSCRAGTFLQEMETDDVAVVLFEGENGCYGEVLVGYSIPPQFTEWRIAGEHGVLSLDDYATGPVRFWSRETTEWTEYECDNSMTRFERQFAHFVECIEEGKTPVSNVETALHTQRSVGAAYQSARGKGLPVQQRKTR